MSNEQQGQKKAAPFGSIAEQRQGLTKGGESKQRERTSDTIAANMPAVQHVKVPAFKQSIDLNEERQQQTAYIPKSLRRWLRVRAPMEDRDISDIVTEALLDYRTKVEGQE